MPRSSYAIVGFYNHEFWASKLQKNCRRSFRRSEEKAVGFSELDTSCAINVGFYRFWAYKCLIRCHALRLGEEKLAYFADNVKRLEIVNDIVSHTINAIQIGEALGGWKGFADGKTI